MKLATVLVILVLWIRYRLGSDTKAVPKYYHTIINCLYLALMAGTAVMVP